MFSELYLAFQYEGEQLLAPPPLMRSILHARAVEGGLRFYPAVHFADVATTARASACAKHGRQWFCACFLGLVTRAAQGIPSPDIQGEL